MANNEILSSYFKEDEKTKAEQKIESDDSFKEVYNRIKANPEYRLARLEEQMEKTDETFEKRFEAFKEAVLEAEKKQKEGLVDGIKQKAEEAKHQLEEKTEEATQKVKKGLMDKMGISKLFDSFNGFFDKVSSGFSKVWDKILLAVGGWLGIDLLGKGDEKKDSKDSEKDDSKEENDTEIQTKKGEQGETPVEVVKPDLDKKEKKLNPLYMGGFNLLIQLSGVNIDSTTSSKDVRKGLKSVKLEDFQKNGLNGDFKNRILGEEYENEKISEQYDNVYNAFVSSEVNDLLKIGLTKDILKLILLGNDLKTENKKLKDSLGQARFSEIKKMLEKDSAFDYKKLTIEELSIFYLQTIPALSSNMLSSVSKEFMGTVTGFLGIEELKGIENNVFSENLISSIVTRGGKNEQKDTTKENMINKLGLSSDKDKEDFGKLYEFKNYIFSKEFLGNKKLLLNEDHKKLLTDKLDYKSILALYTITGGNDIDNINVVNLPIVALFLSKVMSSGSNNVMDSIAASSYLANFSKQLLLKDGDILSEDEYRVLDIYKDKIIDLLILSHTKNFLGTIGLATDKEGMGKLAIGTGVTGVIFKMVGNKGIKRAIGAGKLPFASKWIKRAGIAGILGGIVLGGLSVLSNNNNFNKHTRDLEDAYKKKDPKRIIDILDKQSKGVKEYERDGKKIFLVTYPGADPYIIYDGAVYSLAIFDKSDSLKDSKWRDYALNSMKRMVAERKDTINGKTIKPFIDDNGDIIIGDTGKKIKFSDSINGWEERELSLGVNGKMDDLIKTVFGEDEKWIFGEGKKQKIFKVGDIDDDLLLGLKFEGRVSVEELPSINE